MSMYGHPAITIFSVDTIMEELLLLQPLKIHDRAANSQIETTTAATLIATIIISRRHPAHDDTGLYFGNVQRQLASWLVYSCEVRTPKTVITAEFFDSGSDNEGGERPSSWMMTMMLVDDGVK